MEYTSLRDERMCCRALYNNVPRTNSAIGWAACVQLRISFSFIFAVRHFAGLLESTARQWKVMAWKVKRNLINYIHWMGCELNEIIIIYTNLLLVFIVIYKSIAFAYMPVLLMMLSRFRGTWMSYRHGQWFRLQKISRCCPSTSVHQWF